MQHKPDTKTTFYRPRDHEASPFFKVVRDHFDDHEVVAMIKSWQHTGFSVDNSVRIEAKDKSGMQRLIEYISLCPFSLAPMVSLTNDDKILYRASKPQCIPFPEKGDLECNAGIPRNTSPRRPRAPPIEFAVVQPPNEPATLDYDFFSSLAS